MSNTTIRDACLALAKAIEDTITQSSTADGLQQAIIPHDTETGRLYVRAAQAGLIPGANPRDFQGLLETAEHNELQHGLRIMADAAIMQFAPVKPFLIVHHQNGDYDCTGTIPQTLEEWKTRARALVDVLRAIAAIAERKDDCLDSQRLRDRIRSQNQERYLQAIQSSLRKAGGRASTIIASGADGEPVRLRSGNGSETNRRATSDQYLFRLRGDMWEVRFDGESGYYKNSKGLQIISKLLPHPNPTRPLTAAELAGNTVPVSVADKSQPQVDRDGVKAVQQWLDDDYDRELAAARESADTDAIFEVEDKKRKYEKYLHDAETLGGQPRSFINKDRDANKNSVRQAIRRACDAMRKSMPKLCEHLDSSITISDECAYRPTRPISWKF